MPVVRDLDAIVYRPGIGPVPVVQLNQFFGGCSVCSVDGNPSGTILLDKPEKIDTGLCTPAVALPFLVVTVGRRASLTRQESVRGRSRQPVGVDLLSQAPQVTILSGPDNPSLFSPRAARPREISEPPHSGCVPPPDQSGPLPPPPSSMRARRRSRSGVTVNHRNGEERYGR